MRRSLLAAIGLCLTATACGSSVHVGADGNSLGGLDQSSLQTGGHSSSVPVGESTSTVGTLPGGSVQSPGASPIPGLTDPSAAAGGHTGSAGGDSPIVLDYSKPATGKAVEVGIMYIPDLGAAGANFGGSGKDTSDQRGYMAAAVDWMNAHGGLGGHKITMLYYPAQIAGAKTYDDSEQEYCAMMTQDHHAVAGIVADITIDNLIADCMSRAKAVYVTDGGYQHTTSDWRQTYPFMVSPSEVNSDAVAHELADYMVRQKVAKSGDTVGVIYWDTKPANDAFKIFSAEATTLGLKVVGSAIHYASSTPDLANSITQIQSAELAFKSRGATTVVSLTGTGIGYFLKDAESQKYYPKYVFTSLDDVRDAHTVASGNQLRGSVAMSWAPIMDVNLFEQPKLFTNSTYQLCKTIERSKSQPDVSSQQIAQRVCDSILVLQAAAKAYGGTDITGTTLLEGFNNLGSSYPTASTFSASFSATKHYAPTGYRSMHYDYNSAAFVYDSSRIFPLQ